MIDNATKLAVEALNLAKQPQESDVELICMSDIEARPINWLWAGRIACGKLTVIAGNPGLGKSQIMAALAATVTTGKPWPDAENEIPAGNIIILSAEDDPADTIKPRLIAAGADVKNCHVLSAIKIRNNKGKTGIRTFDLTKDIERLGEVIEKLGNVRLVVIDPISAYLGATDSHNNADIRGVLAPLADMAARYGAAIILVTHLNKSTDQDMIGRVIGSIGLIAAARAGYAVIKDEQKPDIRYFLPIKNNIGNDHDGFAFNIEGVDLGFGIETSKIRWQPGLVDAHSILYPEKKTQTNGAKAFLQEFLSTGEKLASEVFDAADGMGFSKSSISRAAVGLNVKRRKMGMKEGWVWALKEFPILNTEGSEDIIFPDLLSS